MGRCRIKRVRKAWQERALLGGITLETRLVHQQQHDHDLTSVKTKTTCYWNDTFDGGFNLLYQTILAQSCYFSPLDPFVVSMLKGRLSNVTCK